MALNVNISGTLTVVSFSQKAAATLNNAPTINGNSYASNSINIPTGSWTLLPSGSNVDFRYGSFINNDVSSSVEIAIGTTASAAAILEAGDTALIPYSGSANVWAKAIGVNSPVSLSYVLVSYN